MERTIRALTAAMVAMSQPTTNGLYSVPAALVFRAWSRGGTGQQIVRRLLLKNDTAAALVYRLDTPDSLAFRWRSPVPNDGLAVVEAGGSVSLEVELVRDAIDAGKHPEVHAELRARTSRGTLHVPLIALATENEPQAGAPRERWSETIKGEVWPDAVQLIAARRRAAEAPVERSALPGEASVTVTPAAVSEREELAFYSELIRSQPPPRAVPRAPAAAGLSIRTADPSPAADVPAASPIGSPYDEIVELEPEIDSLRIGLGGISSPAGCATARSPVRRGVAGSSARCRIVEIGSQGGAAAGGGATESFYAACGGRAAAGSEAFSSAWEGGGLRSACSGSAPVAVVSARPHPGEEELAFYQSILSRSAGPPVLASAGISAADVSAAGRLSAQSVNTVTDAQLSARRALKQGTYFVIDGFVCDSRGRELGPAGAILGEEEGRRTTSAGRPAAVQVGPSTITTTSDLLAASRAGRHSLGGTLSPAARSSPSRSPVKGGGAAGTLRGGGSRVMSSAPKGAVLSDEQMQANWDALC